MVIHLVTAAVAAATMVRRLDFLRTTLLALDIGKVDRLGVDLTLFLQCLLAPLDALPFLLFFAVHPYILRGAEVLPVDDAGVLARAGESVRPVSHEYQANRY